MTLKKSLKVVKVGGAVLEDFSKRAAFLESFLALEGSKILIHGGGRTATDIGAKLGIEPNIIDGRRITDDDTIDLVTMVYGGLVNKQLVASLQASNTNAIGLSGVDGNLIRSTKRPITKGINYGWVGDPTDINSDLIKSFLDLAIVPVIAPLTHDGSGNMLNTNADTIASVIAVAMSDHFSVDLITTFELEGVFKDINDSSSLIAKMDKSLFDTLQSERGIHSGMIPKLQNAFNALDDGVNAVRICKFDQINSDHGSIIHL